ncbi:MOSC domain-containing protein [Rhizobium sp. BK251]|uniref:MOSC domain-containing protein n=1 Tax=Rhizobium sp. BK251 TaxID=2512125 RepID=UPI00104EBBAB|nr:MOSC domain-containing protein [Rhizobium sp. BK251]TCL71815.1 MOSC domain-containing protein YiiM [Rhizobium sp. BK251]
MQPITLAGLFTGEISPLGPRGVPSGIAKTPVRDTRFLTFNGLEGDAQGDQVRHGGPEKAVHHYPLDHYRLWQQDIGDHALLSAPGAFGENVSTEGLTEASVAVGDIFRLGKATVEVSQGRQPCWKLNERFGRPDMARTVQSTGRTGWYYRVLEQGPVSPGDQIVLIERKSAEWTIARIWHAFYVDTLNREVLGRLAELQSLAEGWRTHAARRLESGKVEDWNKRLTGLD